MDYDKFLATVAYSKIADLSATTVALCLSGLTVFQFRENWQRNNVAVTDTDWNEIDLMIAIANEELMASLVGMIVPHVMATVSAFKFLDCDGGTYLRADYPLLYDAIDSGFIVSGEEFRVPDLRDRVPIGTGNQYNVDDSGGVDSVILTVAQMPPHVHNYNYPSVGVDVEGAGVPDATAVANPPVSLSTSSAGNGEAHENRMPYRAVKFAIVAG